MLERILPSAVAVSSTRGEILEAPLFPVEEELVGRAVEKRRREFTTARACARAALSQLGVEPQAIPAGPRGDPQWPAGTVGSITHCEGYRASVAARSSEFAALGIDAEVDAPLPPGLLSDIALPAECSLLERLGQGSDGVSWDRLLFCAKEAVYKAWFPLAGRWLGFEDAIVDIDPQARTFSARLLVTGPELGGRQLTGFAGSWLREDGIVATAIAVSAPEVG